VPADTAYSLLGLTILVAALAAIVAFALLRFGAAVRDAKHSREQLSESVVVTAAFEEALARLKAQELALTERAEASERLNAEIVSSLTSGLLVAEQSGEVRIVNPAARRLLDTGDQPAAGHYRDFLARAAPLAAVIDECLSTGSPIVRRTIDLSDRNGHKPRLGVTVSPLFDAEHRARAAICLFTDLSAIAELEEQLRLKDSLARLGELTAGLAHEFRNGLATIHGYGRLLDPEQVPGTFRPYVLGIRQETEALGEIVTNFLNFARPEPVIQTRVELEAVIDRVADEMRGDARARGGQIAVTGAFPTIDGDDVMLRQAFSNLVRNSLDACLGIGRAPSVRIDGQIDNAHQQCRITVSDNGPGIDASLRDRVFRPFFTTRAQGTGLGLALVQKIVVTHNGRVVAGTSPDGGATMTITLPLTRRA
jgi:signal transduction histidine kinase